MNGKDILEALGYVDEKYLAEADSAAKRSFRWQPLAAAAACLTLALVGYRFFLPEQKTAVTQTAPKLAQYSTADTAATECTPENAAMMAAALSEMTVRLDRYEDGAAVCIVTDSGTGSYPVGAELRIALMDAAAAETEAAGEVRAAGAAVNALEETACIQETAADKPVETARIGEDAGMDAFAAEADGTAESTVVYYLVSYLPGEAQGDTLQALDMIPLEPEQ